MADYLRNRPFLVITHVQRPSKSIDTRKAGWSTPDTEWDVSENMIVVDRIKTHQMNQATVILDLLHGKVVKNRFGDNNTAVFKAYFDRYQQDIVEALKTWGRKNPENHAALTEASEEGKNEQTDLD